MNEVIRLIKKHDIKNDGDISFEEFKVMLNSK